MGQRTQMIVLINDHERKEHNTGFVFHYQWGVGRKMLLALMGLHRNLYNFQRFPNKPLAEIATSYKDFSGWMEYKLTFHKLKKYAQIEPTQYDEPETKKYTYEDFLTPAFIGDFVDNYCDNNNGVMLVKIDWKSWREKSMAVGWLRGHEDACGGLKAFDRWLSLEEWCDMPINKDYADEDFKKMLRNYMDYFGIEELAPKSEAGINELDLSEITIEL